MADAYIVAATIYASAICLSPPLERGATYTDVSAGAPQPVQVPRTLSFFTVTE